MVIFFSYLYRLVEFYGKIFETMVKTLGYIYAGKIKNLISSATIVGLLKFRNT